MIRGGFPSHHGQFWGSQNILEPEASGEGVEPGAPAKTLQGPQNSSPVSSAGGSQGSGRPSLRPCAQPLGRRVGVEAAGGWELGVGAQSWGLGVGVQRPFGLGGYCSPAGGGPVTQKGLWAGPEKRGSN